MRLANEMKKDEEIKQMQELYTERLVLRKVNLNDVEDMFEYTKNPLSCEYLRWEPHTDIKQSEMFINRIINQYKEDNIYLWGIVVKETNKLIGVIRMFDIEFADGRGELSYILNPNFQGYGYMQEGINCIIKFGFEVMKLHRIQARCVVENYSSENVMKRLGMTLEGILEDYCYIKGKYHTIKIYSIIQKKETSNE